MKSSKIAANFTAKLSNFLPKLKDTSTITVAHQQIRKLFSEFQYADIALAFAAKMDNCDQPTDKEKRQYTKIYSTLMDVYGQEVILEHYERFIDSLAKRTVGVSEVVGQLCKTLLNRVYPTENIVNYIQHLVAQFSKHVEAGKIIKQIAESFDSELISPLQQYIVEVLAERVAFCRHSSHTAQRNEILQALMALILVLEEKLDQSQIAVHSILVKLFKNEDYGTRKLCVDISYSLLIITKCVDDVLHPAVQALKYDKIKHVRDSVSNYNVLYKQLYDGDETPSKKQARKTFLPASFRQTANPHNKAQKLKQHVSKSPTVAQFGKKDSHPSRGVDNKSLEKIDRARNEDFFQNAQKKDVIRTPTKDERIPSKLDKNYIAPTKVPGLKSGLKSPSFAGDSNPPSQYGSATFQNPANLDSLEQNNEDINFSQYLKGQRSPQASKNRPVGQEERIDHFQYRPVNPRFTKQNVQSTTQQDNSSLQGNMSGIPVTVEHVNYDSNPNTFRDQSIMNESALTFPEMKQFQDMLLSLQSRIMMRMDNLESRISNIERKYDSFHHIKPVDIASESEDMRSIEESFEQKYQTISNQSLYPIKSSPVDIPQTHERHVESNLDAKIKQSILRDNWDEAFSLALANGKRQALLELLKPCRIPSDKLVLDCLLLELKKILNYPYALKWLLTYLQHGRDLGNLNIAVLRKMLQIMQRTTNEEEQSFHESNKATPTGDRQRDLRNYKMMKSMAMKQLAETISQYESSDETGSMSEFKPNKHF